MKNRKTNKIIFALLWLLIWQLLSMIFGHDILLPSPVSAVRALLSMAAGKAFWLALLRTCGRLVLGFALSCTLALFLGSLAHSFPLFKDFLAPPVAVIKTVPVASFIILALVWVSTSRLSVLIAALIVFPSVYSNVLEGLSNADEELLEMSRVFSVPRMSRIRKIYIPSLLPYFRAASSAAMGLCFKSGIAAEIIGLPAGTVGEKLYNAKIYLETPELFAWTMAIVFASLAAEKLLSLLISFLCRKEGV